MTLPARIEAIATERRGAERLAVEAAADIATGGEPQDVTILDLSENGFRAIVPEELRVGTWVRLNLKDLPSPDAQVRWRRDGEHGFRFAFPLYAEFVAAALSDAAVTPALPAPEDRRSAADDVEMSWEDYRAGRCRLRGEVVPLSPLMTEIVSTLLMRRGEQLSGLELARSIWPDRQISRRDMATLHVLICRIRDRLPDVVRTLDRGSYMVPTPIG